MKVALTICTRQRPVQLTAALTAIAGLRIPPKTELTTIVIENDTEQHARPIVETFASRFRCNYVQEPEPGLTPARNRGIEAALAAGADWIMTTDDDGEADSGCIAAYLEAVQNFPDALAFIGRTQYIYPEDMPVWYPTAVDYQLTTGSRPVIASTSNSFFSRKLVDAEGLGLRFDDAFRFSGAEDTDFFSRAHRLAGPLVWVQEALVVEQVLPERARLKTLFARQLRNGQNMARVMRKRDRPLAGVLKVLHRAYRYLVRGLIQALAGAVQLLVDENAGLTRTFRGLMGLTISAGMFTSFLFRPLEWYKKTDGF